MRQTFFLIQAFAAAGVLGILGVASVTEAQAQESASLVYRQAPRPAMSIESLESYTLVKLNRVYFNYEASHLSRKEKIALNEMVRRFSAGTQFVIELRGYTDGMESEQRGTALGTRRSQTIAQYLTANGIPSKSILLVTLDEMSDQGRSMNPEHRRVDIRVFAPADSGEGEIRAALQGQLEPGGSRGTERVR
jgi:outer membrane protein OmpA-like peptidoglycan-associated protein